MFYLAVKNKSITYQSILRNLQKRVPATLIDIYIFPPLIYHNEYAIKNYFNEKIAAPLHALTISDNNRTDIMISV